MANRTQKAAKSIKGTNPQYLFEKIIRMRIYDSKYWKAECFGLSAELLVDKAMELRFVGGTYAGNVKPAPFLCLALKLLQIQPDKDIIIEFIRREDFKYARALGAFYLRLIGRSEEIYKYLEPLYNDYRRLRWMGNDGKFSILHMDEFVDRLLREERVCDIQLPRLQKREYLEEAGVLQPRTSALEEDLDNLSSSEDEAEEAKKAAAASSSSSSHSRRHRSPSPRRESQRRRTPPPSSRDSSDHRRRSPEHRSDDRRRRDGLDRKERREGRDKDEGRKRGRDDDDEEREIAEANALRASLGLAPLKP